MISDEFKIVTKDVLNDEVDAKDVDSRYVNGDGDKDPGQELDVEETIVIEEKEPEIVKTLWSGLPSPSSQLWSGITLGSTSS